MNSPRSTRIPVASAVGKSVNASHGSPSNGGKNGRHNGRGGNGGNFGKRDTDGGEGEGRGGGQGGGERGVKGGRGGRGNRGYDMKGKEGGGIANAADVTSMHTVIAVSPKSRQTTEHTGERNNLAFSDNGMVNNPSKTKISPENSRQENKFTEKNPGYNEPSSGSVIVGKKNKKACTVITTIATIEYVNDRKYTSISSPDEEAFLKSPQDVNTIPDFGYSSCAQENNPYCFSRPAGQKRQHQHQQQRYSVPEYSSTAGLISSDAVDSGVRDDISTVLTSPSGPSRPCFPGNSIESLIPYNNNHHNNMNNNNSGSSNNNNNRNNSKYRNNVASPTLPSPISCNLHLTTTACTNSNYNSRCNSRASLLQMQSSTSSSHSFSSSTSHQPSSSSLSSPTSMSSSSTYASHIPTYHHHHHNRRGTPQSSTPSPSGDTSSDRASDSGDGGGTGNYTSVGLNPSPPGLPNGLNNLIAEGRTKVGVSTLSATSLASGASVNSHIYRQSYFFCLFREKMYKRVSKCRADPKLYWQRVSKKEEEEFGKKQTNFVSSQPFPEAEGQGRDGGKEERKGKR
ncbi:hypothetical protein PoB_007559400 [Plakobranchus ocellatus]|uniref:Uncharacterized protein n=1 Tax=Plakobranchus ocellatus TaxID=259542 RepID=A0AAV4DY15_9GAST|nr:hypothetical protein PoB_007559400 [Plakobranchus ocellatus]